VRRLPAIVLVLAACCGRKPVPEQREAAVTSFTAPGDHTAMDAVMDLKPEPAPEAEQAVEDAPPAVPPENREKGQPPAVESAEAGARLLFDAIKADDQSLASGFFFPGPAFDLVKNMDEPARYHRKLVTWFEEDVHTEHERYWGVTTMEYEGFELGGCTWMEPLSQGNRLPYWSCRNSRILARSGKRLFDYRIKAIINWGERWYVIHLGPIRS
jgi:hypothetical protein